MTPALISITSKFKLDESVTDSNYSKLYQECCLTDIYGNMKRLKDDGFSKASDFDKFSSDYQEQMIERVSMKILNFAQTPNLEVPLLSDESGYLKFKPVKITFQVNEANLDSNKFSLNLFFITETLTLVDSLEDKFLFAQGDKSKDIINGTPVPVFFVKHNSNIWFNSYQKIQTQSIKV
jgi:hypothetical protein